MSSWTMRRIVHSETWRSLDMALMDFEGSSSVMPWTCCTKCDILILSQRALCFLRLATLSTLSSDAFKSRRTLWTNDRENFKNLISRSLWFVCIATITVCFFILLVNLLSFIYDLKRKKIKNLLRKLGKHICECPQIPDSPCIF